MEHIVLWTKPNCTYCSRTKKVLNNHNITFEEKILNINFTREQLQEMYPTAKSFPVIVIDGFYIGGYNQLAQRLNEHNNTTAQLLNEQVNYEV